MIQIPFMRNLWKRKLYLNWKVLIIKFIPYWPTEVYNQAYTLWTMNVPMYWKFMRWVNEKFQLVPPHIHHRNSSERAIQNFKEQFISWLASTHKDFPLYLWCRLIPHSSLTLNLLRQSHMNLKLSGYAQLHGEFNYNATPLDPRGTQNIVHDKPTVRGSWEVHGVKGWYLGPSMEHYRYHCVYINKTRGERGSESVDFFCTIILYLTALPQKISSLWLTSWPTPCRNRHQKLHFLTLETPKW